MLYSTQMLFDFYLNRPHDTGAANMEAADSVAFKWTKQRGWALSNCMFPSLMCRVKVLSMKLTQESE